MYLTKSLRACGWQCFPVSRDQSLRINMNTLLDYVLEQCGTRACESSLFLVNVYRWRMRLQQVGRNPRTLGLRRSPLRHERAENDRYRE